MMEDAVCNLHTGLQGAGKTLMTIAHVEALRIKSGREVYYSGIRECTLPWHEFGGPSKDPEKPWWTDPSEWFKLPAGSIILIDEAQRLFRPRGNGSAVPPYEQALETLRHNGHTLFLITQGPKLMSSGVRELAGVHRHFMRKFGSHWVTVHEWASVKDNVAKSRKDSISSQHRYPKEFFDKYKSSEIHTVKFGLPLKVKLALMIPVLFLAGLFYLLYVKDVFRWRPQPVPGAPQPGQVVQPGAPGQPGQAGQGKPAQARPGQGDPTVTAQSLYASMRPRIEGLPFTAPRYDALTAPVRVPVVVGCWVQGDKHGCITQQGSKINVPADFARSFVQAGSFLDFEPGPAPGEARQQGQNGQPSQAQAPRSTATPS